MPERESCGPHPPERLAPARTSDAKAVPPSPKENRLLAALPPADYDRLLPCLDRLPSAELAMTQDLVSHALGVRREGVTEVIGDLQKAGAIHCSRRRIAVLDRSALQARACECYAVVKTEYDRLLYPATGLGADGLQRRDRQHHVPIGDDFGDVVPA